MMRFLLRKLPGLTRAKAQITRNKSWSGSPAIQEPEVGLAVRGFFTSQLCLSSSKEQSMEEMKALQGTEYAIATTDISFKHMLDPSEYGGDVIKSFLNTFVPNFKDDPVTQVKLAPTTVPVLPRENNGMKEKATFMDVHVKVQSGSSCIVEMQSKRHLLFDERALYYLCYTYWRQIGNQPRKDWYLELKPTIALQILDYDSNKVKGIAHEDVEDLLKIRSEKHPLPEGHYVKHYVMQDQVSKQALSHLHMIQVELPRYQGSLFPPQANFSDTDWWLSVLRFSSKYTAKFLQEQERKGIIPPDPIKKAFSRLSYKRWNPEMQKEYKFELADDEDKLKLSWKNGWNECAQSTQKKYVLSFLKKGLNPREISDLLEIPIAIVHKINKKKL
mmetsp:Transcript_18859/g.47942  ORF Transcript_18859/g.47942 Transcript_18859/m.47942 type:complete len:387 (-) Transcript_18859:28-1188(-)